MLPLAERQGGGEPGRAVYLRDLCARSQANHLRVQTSQTSLIFGLKSDVSRSSQVALQSCGAPLRTQPGAAFILLFFSLSPRAAFLRKLTTELTRHRFLSSFSIFRVRGTCLFISTCLLNRDHRTWSRNAKHDELSWAHLTRVGLLTHKSSRAATSPAPPAPPLLSGSHYDGLNRLTRGSVSPRGHRFGSSCRPQATCPLNSPKFSETNQINQRQTWGEVGTAEPPPVQRK